MYSTTCSTLTGLRAMLLIARPSKFCQVLDSFRHKLLDDTYPNFVANMHIGRSTNCLMIFLGGKGGKTVPSRLRIFYSVPLCRVSMQRGGYDWESFPAVCTYVCLSLRCCVVMQTDRYYARTYSECMRRGAIEPGGNWRSMAAGSTCVHCSFLPSFPSEWSASVCYRSPKR